MQLKEIGKDIWIYDGRAVKFYGLPYSTRMTVIKLNNGSLWIHSPEKLNEDLKKELESLGKVEHLISPNKLHHLFLSEWIAAYPDAKLYASPGLAQKRADIKFTKELSDFPETDWANEIDQIIFQGSPLMEEVVFFHTKSKTLILTDLIENFDPAVFNWWQKPLAWIVGILSPDGKTPLDWRMSFLFGKAKARISVNKMLGWKPENIIISHGECIIENGFEFLERSFKWVK